MTEMVQKLFMKELNVLLEKYKASLVLEEKHTMAYPYCSLETLIVEFEDFTVEDIDLGRWYGGDEK